jgi:phage terminase large subunit
LYGGAAGGGKSKALLMEGLRACMNHPGIRVGAFRRTFPELEESLLAELAQVNYAKALGARYQSNKHDLVFPNGSMLMFRYAKNLQDATVRQGAQYQLLLFDEMTLFPPAVVKFLQSRLRSGSTVPVLGIRGGSNPGGAGHGVVKKKYIDATDKGAKVIIDKRKRSVRFIQSKATDNPHLNEEYVDDLEDLDEAMRAAFRDGSWDSFTGQVFTEWADDRHIVPRFAIPESWRRYTGTDYGWSAPWVVLWAAQDQDGRVWVYREITDTQVIEKDQAKRIRASEADGEKIGQRFADPAMWAKTGEAQSVADQYASVGVHLTPALNDRINGKQRVHSYLAEAPACAHHRAMGWETCPALHVLEGTAPELVRTLPTLPYDLKKIEDVDTNAEDHHYDALRYLLVMLGSGPRFVLPKGDDRVPLTEQVGAVVGEPFNGFAYVPPAHGPATTTSPGSAKPGGTVESPW